MTKVTKDNGGFGLKFNDWKRIAELGKDIGEDLLNTKPALKLIE